MDQVAWSDSAPLYPSARIWTPEAGKSVIVLLGPGRGVWVHWVGKRTLPCLGDGCPASRHRRPVYWMHYTPAARPVSVLRDTGHVRNWQTCVVPIGADNWQEIRPTLGAYPGPVVSLEKAPKSRSWQITKIAPLSRARNEMPAGFDVAAVLYRVWGIRPPEEGSAGKETENDGVPDSL